MQSTSDIKSIVNKAKSWATEGITPALALTDHANMMAAFQFVSAALKSEVKPIIGCEVNLCRDMHDKKKPGQWFSDCTSRQDKKRVPQPRALVIARSYARFLLRSSDRPQYITAIQRGYHRFNGRNVWRSGLQNSQRR